MTYRTVDPYGSQIAWANDYAVEGTDGPNALRFLPAEIMTVREPAGG